MSEQQTETQAPVEQVTPAITQETPNTTTDTDSSLLGGDAKADSQSTNKPADTEELPIEYGDFNVSEGLAIADSDLALLKELGQAHKLPHEALQKLVDMGSQIQQRQQEQYQQQVSEWAAQAKSDKEYGGDKLEQTLSTGRAAFALPRGDKVRNLLNETGLGNHPDVIGFFAEVGRLMSNDQIVTGKPNSNSVALPDILYDKS